MSATVDLHVHSCYSDGLLTPDELVQRAAERGLTALGIADHDTVDGINEAMDAGTHRGIDVLPAVELSVEYGGYHDVHLLGYVIDHRDGEFLRKLAEFRKQRDDRGRQIIERINALLTAENKNTMSYNDLGVSGAGALGRPHIARQLVAKGFAKDIADAFSRYLEPCDVPKTYFPMDEALQEIHRIKGISVLAHPTSMSNDWNTLRKVLGELAEMGLNGVEAYNNMATRDDSLFLAGTASRLGMITTGGSDFHGEDTVVMGEIRNGIPLVDDHVRSLRELHERLYPGMWRTHCGK